MRIVFMGTPAFAVPSLQILLENGYEVCGVVTATDKPVRPGSSKMIVSDVKQFALSKGLTILQPEKLRSPEFIQELKDLNADLQIVVAFRMLPEIVWNMPKLGTINLHGSLLPKYRGAAPINWAIMRGEQKTGLTTFFISHEIDTGNLLFQTEVAIEATDNFGTLHDKMMQQGAELVLKTVKAIENQNYTPQRQDENLVTSAPKLDSETGRLDFNKSCIDLHNQVRGLSPRPGAYTLWEGKLLKIFKTIYHLRHPTHPIGTFVLEKKSVKIAAQDGYLELLELQPEGKKVMSAQDFLNGLRV